MSLFFCFVVPCSLCVILSLWCFAPVLGKLVIFSYHFYNVFNTLQSILLIIYINAYLTNFQSLKRRFYNLLI